MGNIDDEYISVYNDRPDDNGDKKVCVYGCPIQEFAGQKHNTEVYLHKLKLLLFLNSPVNYAMVALLKRFEITS